MVLPDGVLNQLRERDRLRVQQLLEVEDAEVLQIVRGENRVLGGVMEALRKMASEAQPRLMSCEPRRFHSACTVAIAGS